MTELHSDGEVIVQHVADQANLDLSIVRELVSSRTARLFRLRGSGRDFCLKIRREECFETEEFWHALMRARSLPTARLYVHGTLGSEYYALFDWLQGEGAVVDGDSLGRAIGQSLSRMHDVAVDGVGIVRFGAWEFEKWGPFVDDNVQRFFMSRLREIPDEGLAARVEDALQTLVSECREAKVAPRLLHGDLGIDNVIHERGELVGLIDPGWCIGGDPLLDVSYFLTVVSNASILRGFKAGYHGYADLDQRRLASYAAYHCIAKLMHVMDMGARERVDAWTERVTDLLG